MDEQMMREKFEAAWDSWGWAASPADFWDAEHGSYVDGGIQWAWQGFRAALSQPAAQVDPCRVDQFSSRICEKGTKSCTAVHSAGGECGGVTQPAVADEVRADLLKALQDVVMWADDNGRNFKFVAASDSGVVKRIHAAIAKATP